MYLTINVVYSVTVGNCPTPVASPSGTIIDCYTVDAEHQACWASCPAGKAFLRQVPKLYTCGPSGVWDTSNPFAVFTLPHCGSKDYKDHDDVIKWKHFPRYWPFVRGIHTHKGQWRRALMFSLICARINGWVNNGEAGHFRRHRSHYDVTVMWFDIWPTSH